MGRRYKTQPQKVDISELIADTKKLIRLSQGDEERKSLHRTLEFLTSRLPKKPSSGKVTTPKQSVAVDVEVYCDGGCWPNPGLGGWACIVRELATGREVERSGAVDKATNQRMEILAACEGLESIGDAASVLVTTDSQYVVKGASEWIHGWKRRGWMTRDDEPVKNRELWERLDASLLKHRVQWRWVKGHNGHAENERCDVLAMQARDNFKTQVRA